MKGKNEFLLSILRFQSSRNTDIEMIMLGIDMLKHK